MMDAEDWKEKILEELVGRLEEGELIISEESEIDELVVETINAKYESDVFDEEIRDELLESATDIAEELKHEFQFLDEDDDESPATPSDEI